VPQDLGQTDFVVDFSSPENTLSAAKALGEARVPTLIGTTGFTAAQKSRLKKYFGSSRHCLIPNTAPGVFATEKALVSLSQNLGSDFSLHVEELHHAQKKDAPSGTAKRLLEQILDTKKRKHSTTSLRAGQTVGVHRFVWMGPFERIEITHVAESRSLFAHGALNLGIQLAIRTRLRGDVSPESLFRLST
jgi:4-hydroxy-tetrahydrodipicolinate reductase